MNIANKQKRKKQTNNEPLYARLLPNCGCEGDGTGFMIELNAIYLCQCTKCRANPAYTKWAGSNGELTESLAKDLNDNTDGTIFVLLPGVFSLTWYRDHDDPMKAKWASIEEYRASEEAKNPLTCEQTEKGYLLR